MATSQRVRYNTLKFLASKQFFWIVVVIFLLESSWIALSARYPQAFDEQYHLGIIQLYAHQLSPIFSHQPIGTGKFGALTRDPSYLYHYLMSFPYRWIAHFTSNLPIQVIILRFLNIGMLGSSLLIFRRLFRFTSASKALINVSLLFFVLIPVVPLLASQINYDNLLIPLVGVSILLYVRFKTELVNKNVWRWDILAQLVITALLASLVKYAYLPVLAALLVLVVHTGWKRRMDKHMFRLHVGAISPFKKVVYGGLLAISVGLFVQMYGVNIVRYHNPVPDCGQVLSVSDCRAYPPWGRNYNIAQYHNALSPKQVTTYPFVWLYRTMGELVFTIGSSFNDDGDVDYYVGTQLIALEVISWTLLLAAAALCLRYWKFIWQQPVLRVFIIVSGLYILALFGQNYRDYLRLGAVVAVHGRYLLPVLPMLFLIGGIVFSRVINDMKRFRVPVTGSKLVLTAATFVVLLQGGGIITYILRSEPRWFWPQSSAAQHINAKAKKILKPVVVDTNKQ